MTAVPAGQPWGAIEVSGTDQIPQSKSGRRTAAVQDASRDVALHEIPTGFGLRLSFCRFYLGGFSVPDTINIVSRSIMARASPCRFVPKSAEISAGWT